MLLIVEPRSKGHLLVYVRVIADEVEAIGGQALLALGDGVKGSPEYVQHLGSRERSVVSFPTKKSVRHIERIARENNVSQVVVPHGDEFLLSAAAFGYRGPGTISLLVMRDPSLEDPVDILGRLKRLLKLVFMQVASSRRNVRVLHLQPWGAVKHKRGIIDPFIPDGTFQEIHEAAREIRDQLNLRDSVFWFLVTGSITERKNIPLIIEAIAEVNGRRPDLKLGLLLFGPINLGFEGGSEWIRTFAEQRGVTVKIQDRLISNFEMNAVIAATDAVILAYSSRQPNSTLVKAYALGARLVVAATPTVCEFAKNLGFRHVSGLAIDALAESLVAIISEQSGPTKNDVAPTASFVRDLLGGG